MNEKYLNEYNKILEIGKKKKTLKEEDICQRFLKYEPSAAEIDEIIAELKQNGIKIISTLKTEDEKVSWSNVYVVSNIVPLQV